MYIGDSTSEGMVMPSYLPDPDLRLNAQLARVGATTQYIEISGARSTVETLSGQANAYDSEPAGGERLPGVLDARSGHQRHR